MSSAIPSCHSRVSRSTPLTALSLSKGGNPATDAKEIA
jgi:hypothetical protein